MQYKLFLNAAGIAAVAVALCVGCDGGNNGVNPPGNSKPTLSVSASPANGGSVSRDPSSSSYANGDEVTVTATAASGYVFTGWSGASTSTDASITVTMDGNKTLTAIFKRLYTLTTNTSPSSGGSVSRDPDKTSYADGEQVTLTAVDNDGYIFAAWGGASTSTSAGITITMNSDKTLTANFKSATVAQGETIADKLVWLKRTAESHNTYLIEVSADENIAPQTLEYTGAINITVIIRGVGANRTIRLSQNGTMFMVNSNVTFILDNNITLQGHSKNAGSLVLVRRGTFIMNNGSVITGNDQSSWYEPHAGGVCVDGGTFTMNGGTISGNSTSRGGGGVYVYSPVYSCTFTMTGGTISGNTTAESGGGVHIGRGAFNMRGGTITGNAAREYGGGVCVNNTLVDFTKTGGIITGYSSDQASGNAVRDNQGVLSRRGHAVYRSGYRRETTAGPEVNLSSSINANWEN
jgi:uncharacterized repeat protein (TIGR02543 family)